MVAKDSKISPQRSLRSSHSSLRNKCSERHKFLGQYTRCCLESEPISWLPAISFSNVKTELIEANIWSRFKSNLNGRSMPNLLKWNFWLLKIWQIYIDVSSFIWTIQSECLNIFVFFKFYSINFWSMGNLLKWNFWLLPFASQISLSHCLSPKLGLPMMPQWWGKTFWDFPRFVFSTLNNISRSFQI